MRRELEKLRLYSEFRAVVLGVFVADENFPQSANYCSWGNCAEPGRVDVKWARSI
jgi:hypothetical protein